MKKVLVVTAVLIGLGCARVNVATDKPLKVDINMRVDVYQHVVEDVESINDQIYGVPEKKLNYLFGCQTAFAADLSETALQAIQRRKLRIGLIEEYFQKGYIGENQNALLQLRSVPDRMQGEVKKLINEENADRKLIQKEIAEKNNTRIEQVQKVFLAEDYQRAPDGAWFEIYNSGQSKYIWQQK